MLTHKGIWVAIETLASRNGLTASGLAKRAGLDPTTFNRSKRISNQGKPRWPGTESVSKVLEATGTPLGEFVALLEQTESGDSPFRVPVIGLAQAGDNGFFDDSGFPAGSGWDEVAFPDIGDSSAYALEVAGDSMVPVYRDGDIIIVSPQASIRRGDRVVVKTLDGEVMAKQLRRKSARRVDLQSLNPSYPDRVLAFDEIDWMARIVWASQ